MVLEEGVSVMPYELKLWSPSREGKSNTLRSQQCPAIEIKVLLEEQTKSDSI